MKDRIYIPRSPRIKGRKLMRSLNKESVIRAMSKQDGMQAVKFLHPRRLRSAIVNKQIPDGTYAPEALPPEKP